MEHLKSLLWMGSNYGQFIEVVTGFTRLSLNGLFWMVDLFNGYVLLSKVMLVADLYGVLFITSIVISLFFDHLLCCCWVWFGSYFCGVDYWQTYLIFISISRLNLTFSSLSKFFKLISANGIQLHRGQLENLVQPQLALRPKTFNQEILSLVNLLFDLYRQLGGRRFEWSSFDCQILLTFLIGL